MCGGLTWKVSVTVSSEHVPLEEEIIVVAYNLSGVVAGVQVN